MKNSRSGRTNDVRQGRTSDKQSGKPAKRGAARPPRKRTTSRERDRERFTMGIDLGDRFAYFCQLDTEGEVVERGRFTMSPAGLERTFVEQPQMTIALEAGSHSHWVSRRLEELGHNVLVANPRQLALIYQSDRKDDRTDAESLARLARLDPKLLRPIKHRSKQAQGDLEMLRARDALLRCRTVLINHARSVVKVFGARLRSSSADYFHRHVAPDIPKELWSSLSPIIDQIGHLTHQVKKYEAELELIADTRYPVTKLLREVVGVGLLTSLGYVLTLEDPKRFEKSRDVGPYLGLVPRRDDSGESRRQLAITKAGNSYMRRLLVNASHYILGPFGPDCDLRRWGLKLAERGGKAAKKRAVIAVSRKLAIVLHRIWSRGLSYDPFYNSRRNPSSAVVPA